MKGYFALVLGILLCVSFCMTFPCKAAPVWSDDFNDGSSNARDHATKRRQNGSGDTLIRTLCLRVIFFLLSAAQVMQALILRDRALQEIETHKMRNDECVIHITNKRGEILQTYRREKNGWIQASRNGTVRHCTAEQLLSHVLPPLAGVSPARVKVESRPT